AGVVKILQTRRAMLEERAGARLTLAAIADTDLTRPREGLALKSLPLTGDAAQVLGAPAVHIVIELVGGLEPARTFILRALAAGTHVVTANKALLAHHGAELYEEARRRGVSLGFEAAVAGGIPLIRAVKEGLVANRVLSLAGIVNGTCNYILSKMTDEGLDFSLVLKEAQAHGYAEADPTLDIEGMDSAHKLQILVALAVRAFVDLKAVHPEGISRVTAQDIDYGRELGYRIKLLAIAKATASDAPGGAGVEVRVHPTMIPAASPLAAVSGVFNGIFLTGDAVGDLMFYGRGAGQMPTASAVLSDVVEIARRIAHGIPSLSLELPSIGPAAMPLTPIEAIPPPPPRPPPPPPRAPVDRPGGDAPPPDGGDPLPLLPARHRPGQAGRAVAGRRHPRRARHLDRQCDPEGPRSARGHSRGHADPRGARARHARGAGEDRPAPGRRGRDDDDPRGGWRGVKTWRGVIEEYRDFLPVTDKTPIVTLYEGNTPLVPAPRPAAATDSRMEIHLKCEGFNPTGSFKDRGMTLAIS